MIAGFRHYEEGEYVDADGVSPRSDDELQHVFGMVGGDRTPLGLGDGGKFPGQSLEPGMRCRAS